MLQKWENGESKVVRKKNNDTDSICNASSPLGNCLRKPHKDKWHVTDAWIAGAIDNNIHLKTIHLVSTAWIWFGAQDKILTVARKSYPALLNGEYFPLLIPRCHAINLIREDIKRSEAAEKYKQENTLDD